MRKVSTPQFRYRGWDEKTNRMRPVLSVSLDEEFVIFKDAPDEKISLFEVKLLRCMGVTNDRRKTIYEGDIIDFVIDGDIERAIVEREDNEWFFHVVNTDKRIMPWEQFSNDQLREIEIVGNKFQNKERLSEEAIRNLKVWQIGTVLGDLSGYMSIHRDDYCRHDLQRALERLSDLTKEELIDMVKSLSESLRYYKKECYEQSQRCRRKGPCDYYKNY